jgi:hypothetical protein
MVGFVDVGRLPADSYGNIPPKSGGSVGTIRGDIAYTDTTSFAIGDLPMGAVIIDFHVHVRTIFNDTGTDLLIVGFSDNDDALVDDLSGAALGLFRAGAASTTPVLELNATPTTEIKTLHAKYTGANADATTGLATFTLFYTREES